MESLPAEFENVDPPKISDDRSLPQNPFRPPNEKGISYQQWIEELRGNGKLVDSLKIWERKNGKLLGFGSGGRKLFKTIAHRIWSFHLAKYFCGDLYNRIEIFVKPELRVSFKFAPVKDDNRLIAGMNIDLVHFRYLVAFLVKATKIEFSELPEDFSFFFSKIFTGRKCIKLYFFQFFHPIFFDGKDRISFMQAVIDYRKIDISNFDRFFNLSKYSGCKNWQAMINSKGSAFSAFKAVLNRGFYGNPNFPNYYGYYAAIPRYIRNVYAHHADHKRETERQKFESELNEELFPAICSKILDFILRRFAERDGTVCRKFFAVFKDQTRGFQTEIYCPVL